MDSNANLFQKHHLRNTQNQCYIKLTITETINKGHPNEGSLLRIQGLVLLAQGMEWILGWGDLRQEAQLLHKMEVIMHKEHMGFL